MGLSPKYTFINLKNPPKFKCIRMITCFEENRKYAVRYLQLISIYLQLKKINMTTFLLEFGNKKIHMGSKLEGYDVKVSTMMPGWNEAAKGS